MATKINLHKPISNSDKIIESAIVSEETKKSNVKTVFLFAFVCVSLLCNAQDDIIIDGKPCGLHGSSEPGRKEYEQNTFKNRYNFPKTSDFEVNLELSNFTDGKATKDKFSQNKAVEVTGYVYDVKVGGKETCNCKTTDPLFRDTHIELTLNSDDTGPEKRFIVEVTPRIRQIMEEKGIDWTTETLKAKLKHRMVKIQGWLFYDFSHENENYSDDPDDNIGNKNWRSSSWEIHPITSIEILDEEEAMASSSAFASDDKNISPPIIINPKPNNINPNQPKTNNSMETTPLNTLIIIILGAILGMVGQGLRVIVGLKKIGDEAASTGQPQKDLIKTQQIVLSLFIAFSIGAIAGVLAAVGSVEVSFTKSTIFAFIAAGYAGTDFIEGFISKNPSVTKKP